MSKKVITKQEAERVIYRERKQKRAAVWIDRTTFNRFARLAAKRERMVGEFMSAVVKRELDRRGA